MVLVDVSRVMCEQPAGVICTLLYPASDAGEEFCRALGARQRLSGLFYGTLGTGWDAVISRSCILGARDGSSRSPKNHRFEELWPAVGGLSGQALAVHRSDDVLLQINTGRHMRLNNERSGAV